MLQRIEMEYSNRGGYRCLVACRNGNESIEIDVPENVTIAPGMTDNQIRIACRKPTTTTTNEFTF